jgi:membrane-associated HD superfamily phosphohydrolase
LYYYFANAIEITLLLKLAMVTVGVIFVINSVDSLVRLYTDNLGIKVEKLGRPRFILLNVSVLAALVLLFKFTPFEIQSVGLVVIGLYAAAITTIVWRHRPALAAIND